MKESAASLRAAAALLPVAAVRERLLAELRSADTTILVGETGSGKSTQVPPLILDAGLARGRRVAVTQPRRVAAASVATRVAAERGVPLGGDVGYRVRFKDVTTEATRLVYLTDGLLARDALLEQLGARLLTFQRAVALVLSLQGFGLLLSFNVCVNAVPYFRTLQRLLLVHGRYSYYRTCECRL